MTSLSTVQIEACQAAMSAGLLSLRRDAPQTPVAWADDNFYLSSESSYQEGRWETLPYQVAMLNAMGNDEIRIVNVIKSARVGYSKMLLAASAYQIEHKRRHIAFFVPDDGSADLFMKSEIETMIRDVGAVRALAPWCGKKSRDNTLDIKKFSHGKQLWCRGGKAAKNYRAISADTVIYDELAAFDHDIDKEGLRSSWVTSGLKALLFRNRSGAARLSCEVQSIEADARLRVLSRNRHTCCAITFLALTVAQSSI